MSSPNKVIRHTIYRILIVLATTLATGFLFFQSSIFILTTSHSQFLTSGITTALFYMHSLKHPRCETLLRQYLYGT